MQSTKQLARIGIFYLEEAVLDVLFQATEENQLVIAAEIRRKIGLGEIDESNWVVRGILRKLKNEERVEQREERGPWKLTETEYQRRC